MNQVQLVGNLGRDPEVKRTKSGTAVATISLATSTRKKVNDEWVDHTDWHKVVIWSKRAETIGKYCRKGDKLAITGRLETRSYEKDGGKVYVTEVIADNVEMLSPKGERGAKPQGPQAYDGGSYSPEPSDDLPF